jgi:hypothetical protein
MTPRPRPWLALPFAACAVILVIAAIGLRPAVAVLTQTYSKLPIPIRRSLESFDAEALPSFRPVEHVDEFSDLFERLNLRAGVGTKDFTRVVFEPRTGSDPYSTDDNLTLLVSYYSDPRDTVPHTPEVCYRQGGAVVRSIRTVDVEIPGGGGEPRTITALQIEFTPVLLVDGEAAPAAPDSGWRQTVVYTFVCNAAFYADREQVRWAIGRPGDRYTYFAMVEVVSTSPPGWSFDEREAQARRLLGEALAVLLADHFPRADQVR